MTQPSLEHRIRVSLGNALHRRHHGQPGVEDIESIASEHGVSEDQVMEQVAWLREQNLIDGPLQNESGQISHIPASEWPDHKLTSAGLEWAGAGFPYRHTA
jgi:hypothetical protein